MCLSAAVTAALAQHTGPSKLVILYLQRHYFCLLHMHVCITPHACVHHTCRLGISSEFTVSLYHRLNVFLIDTQQSGAGFALEFY